MSPLDDDDDAWFVPFVLGFRRRRRRRPDDVDDDEFDCIYIYVYIEGLLFLAFNTQ